MVPLLSVMVLTVYSSAWEMEKMQKEKKRICVFILNL